MTNNNFRTHRTSGNGRRGNHQEAEAGTPTDRRQNLRYAAFYLVVAIILFLTNRVSKHPTDVGNLSQSASNPGIDLSVARKFEGKNIGTNGAGGTYIVRFRLTNQGNQPIFYPVSSDTNRPIGHILYRVAPQPDWKPISESEPSASTRTRLNGGDHISWIEMPPGGWADGEYEDPGSPGGDHALELEVKVATDGKVSPLLSRPYSVNSN